MMRERGGWVTHVHQGEFIVSADEDVVLTTVLGSCVAACLHEPEAGVGGINHFLLPEAQEMSQLPRNSYGVHLMELLLNGMLNLGARRDRIQAKLFGGGRLVRGLSDIGARNAIFAEQFLQYERIPIVAHSLRGTQARRLRYWPTTGRTQQRFVMDDPELFRLPTLQRAPRGNGVELF